ncbi:CapA family protein [Undibacterium fentianense]|uniref:CapA family protein n=1 Tax=Undibacterium fentianense TaxID=2828728 RepID=A0A941E452_9BURK|nr:CapA family protein [Undibacterium fentianense]MBR7800249.1 CapA family protein [Undibacterium fentianense]
MNFLTIVFRYTARLLLSCSVFSLSSPIQATPQSKEISILFVGDMVLDDLPGKTIAQGNDPFDHFKSIFAAADIRIGNLECVIATSGRASEKNFTFRAHPRVVPILKKYFDAVSIANNHSGDFGPDAFNEMLSILEQHDLSYFGGGRNLRDAHRPHIIEKNGLRIALLGYDEFMPRSFEANTNKPGVAWSEDEQVIADIRNAKSQLRADIVIPFMHWGWENEKVANQRQRQLARKMIDAGADAVIGGHPHVIQDTETYKGKPIIYSIGNFMMDALDNEAQTLGWAVRLRINQHGVHAWDTRVAKINSEGIPHPLMKKPSPCWNKKGDSIEMCNTLQ